MEFDKVILVDEFDNELGVMDKMEAHIKGHLHRAFSIFLFNNSGELLLQRRAADKYHSGGLWTNTCCSHPQPGRPIKTAANLRLWQEMGIRADISNLYSFRYRADFSDEMIEHEYDHVFVGQYSGPVNPDSSEVMDYRFASLEEIEIDLTKNPEKYTVWFSKALEGITVPTTV